MDKFLNITNISKFSSRIQICKGVSKAYSTTGTIEIHNKNQAISSHESSPARQNISCELSTHKNPLEMEVHEDK